jgi:transcriptional regulator with XRE-family HTH domain
VAEREPSALRWLIGVELAHFRTRARLSLADLAATTGIKRAKLGHLETGRSTQHPDDVTKVLKACRAGQHDIDRLTSLASQSDQATWWAPFSEVVPDSMKTAVGLESLASAEFAYEPLLLHGMLQTPDYAAALLVNNLRVAPMDIDRVVRVRIARQRRLTDVDNPLRYRAVIEEAVLDRLVGGPEVMRPQLEHLLDLARRDNITLHVMPLSVAVHGGLDGEFTLFDFAKTQSIGYVEFADGAVYIQDQDQVAAHAKIAESMCSLALSPEDSIEVIRRRLAALN